MYNFLNENIITDDLTISLGNVFKKLDTYSRNRNLAVINESQYGRYNRNIRLNLNEQKAVRTLFMMMEHAAAESIINEHNLDINYVDFKLNENNVQYLLEGKIASELKVIKEFFAVIIRKAVDSIEKFIKLLVEIFSKLGENIQAAVKKLLGKSLDNEGADLLPKNEITNELEDSDKGFLGLVYDYLIQRIKKDNTAKDTMKDFSSDLKGTLAEGYFPKQNWPILNEAWFKRSKKEDPKTDSSNDEEYDPDQKEYKNKFDKFVHTNKPFQWLVGYKPGKGKIKWWKSLLASIVGSIIFTLIIPAILTVCFGSGPAIATICFAIQMTWATKGVCRVLLSRYTSKEPGEKFWNRQTAIAFCIAVAFMIIPRIPAVREWMAEGVRDFLHWTGLDQKINDVEDWFRNLMGAVKTEKNVVTRYEKISEHLEKYVPRTGTGQIDNNFIGVHDTAADAIKMINTNDGISSGMKKGLIQLQELVNNQSFKSSIAMDNFMPGKLHGAEEAAYMFDMSRAMGKGGKFEGKSVEWVSNWLKERLQTKGIGGETFNIVNDTMRDQTNSIAGSTIVFATDIPVTQGADFEGIFADIAKEAGIEGEATGTIGVLLNDLNDTISVQTEEIVSKPIHTFTDFIANNFVPMFFPRFAHSGEWCAVYVGDKFKNRYPIVDRKEMTYEELDKLSPRNDGNSWNVIARKMRAARRKELMERIEQVMADKKAGKFTKEQWTEIKKEYKKEITVYNNFKPAECKVLVFFTTGKFLVAAESKNESINYKYNKYNLFEEKNFNDNDSDIYTSEFDDEDNHEKETIKYKEVELKNAPLFAWNPYILYHCDLNEITMKNNRNKKNQWLMRGLFKAHMRIEPLKAKNKKNPYDSATGREIKKKINTVFDSMIKTAANGFGMEKLAYVKDEKYHPIGEPEKNIKLMGNFKTSELCKIWNKEEAAWKYLWISDEKTDKQDNPPRDPRGSNVLVPVERTSTALQKKNSKKDNSKDEVKQIPSTTEKGMVVRGEKRPVPKSPRVWQKTKQGDWYYPNEYDPRKNGREVEDTDAEEITDEGLKAPHKINKNHMNYFPKTK